MINTVLDKRMFKHNDYRREMAVRALDSEDPKKMPVEGRAVVFETPTVLFNFGGTEYKEIIDKDAFAETDFSKCYMKYNHSDNVMVMARFKNGTLSFEIREDGLWFKADLANTTAGRDLYELLKRGDIDKMSFAFSIREESFDETLSTWRVRKIDKLFDVAAVEQPAYEDTQVYARRFGEVETLRKQQVEALSLARKRAEIKLKIHK